jgi:chromatin modification-related protein EAF6
LDQEIHTSETRYLEETTAGNIVKGWDNFAKGASTTLSTGGLSGGTSTRRKGGISDADRIFSKSSVAANVLDSPVPSSSATPSHAPTPTSANTPGGAANNKAAGAQKKKKNVGEKEEDDTDAKSTKRLKVSYGRE